MIFNNSDELIYDMSIPISKNSVHVTKTHCRYDAALNKCPLGSKIAFMHDATDNLYVDIDNQYLGKFKRL
jgi:hypothetical protein